MTSASEAIPLGDNIHYTVFIRLPFPRGDFIDPPAVEWSSAHDRELWDVLSTASSKGKDLDWQATADRFDVALTFLTQQAAWLYERQLSQVRAQLRKVSKPLPIGTLPDGSDMSRGHGGHAMIRGDSGGSRIPSSLSHRPKEPSASCGEGNMEAPSLSRGQPMSRTTSTNTVTQIHKSSPSASPRSPTERRSSTVTRSREASRRTSELPQPDRRHFLERNPSPSAIASDSSSSSSSESDAPHPMSRSRAFAARRPRFSSTKAPMNPLSDADEEDDDSPPFLPFSAARPSTPPPISDPSTTIKTSPKRPPQTRRVPAKPPAKDKPALTAQTPHSSSSSAQSQNRTQHKTLSTLSPKQRRATREGSEGTPSMGSSFSDLDDASVTQSALEETLANEMAQGGIGSRMSTISQALKSRYLQ